MRVQNIDSEFPHDRKKGKVSHLFLNRRCALLAMEEHPNMSRHVHDFDELVFILGGSGVHVVDDDKFPIIRGDVFVLRGSHKHGYTNTNHLYLVNVLYQRDYFESFKEKFSNLPGFQALFVHEPMYRKKHKFKSKLHLNSQQLEKLFHLIQLMSLEQQDEWAGTGALLEGFFELIIINVCKFYSEVSSPRPKALLRISAAIDFMENNYTQPISTLLLAQKADMSESTFRHTFKEITELPPIDYLIRLRIEKAVEMMVKDSSIKVIDVSLGTGFDNSAYFTRKFKQIMKITPMQYLKKERDKI